MGVKIKVPTQELVDACSECNKLLGGRYLGTKTKRKVFLKRELLKKYTKILDYPDWEDDSIEELDGRLKEYVVILQEAKATVKNALSIKLRRI